MLDSLDAWANGDVITTPVSPVIINTPAPAARTIAPRARTKSSRRNAIAARNAALAAATTPKAYAPQAVTATPPAFGFTAPNGETGDLALDALKSAFPAEHAWIAENAARGNSFAYSLLRCVRRFGRLTVPQLAAVTKGLGAPVADTAPAPQSAPVVASNPAPYVAPVAVVPVTKAEGFTLSPDPLADHWPVLFTDESGHAVADTGGGVLCIAVQGLPVKLARFAGPGLPPVTVQMCESVWRDFKAMTRAEFIAAHLA